MSIKCTNPVCGAEIPGGSKFCGSCGTQAPAAESHLANSGVQVGDIGYMDGDINNTTQQGHASLGAINVHLGGQSAGQQATAQLLQCPLCGCRNDEKNIFRCRECGIDHLCLEHLDRDHFICLLCVKKRAAKEQEKEKNDSDIQVVLCPLCGRRNKLLDTFQCRSCCKDHLCLDHHEASENICSTCLQELATQKAEEEADQALQDKLGFFFSEESPQLSRENIRSQLLQELAEEWRKQPRPGHNFTEPITGIEMIWVPGGEFDMGGWDDEAMNDEKPVHRVELDGFWIGKFPVTQGQYQRITGTNPSENKKGDDFPVDTVSWDDAREYISKLEKQTGISFRLPTEAEWEYAARSGGRREKYAGSNQPDSVAWYRYTENSSFSTHRVGTKDPNGLGLYDMSGNVCEWCSDWRDEYYYASSLRNNPQGPSSGSRRVLRGGSCFSIPRHVRTAHRNSYEPGTPFVDLGFRLVLPEGSK